MFINDKIIFLQLDKAASTHIAKLLHGVAPGEFLLKHSPLERDPEGRCVIGSVRNPWDWYVSLWAYGCKPKGKVQRQLTRSFSRVAPLILKQLALHPADCGKLARKAAAHARKDAAYWRRLYSSVDDPELFREWLRAIMSEPVKDLLFGKWDYPALPLRRFSGVLSYRFLALFVDLATWQRKAGTIRSFDEMQALYAEHGIVDRFIRVERLEQDLSEVLRDLGIEFDRDSLFANERTNVSGHRGPGFYYDAETVELVAQQERLLISEFGYSAPELDERSPGHGARRAPGSRS